ncbi:hypothetical protein PIB30_002221 [Stylosanthes scabra]|uniref:Uncharacterized protein n=1 Tax=Stylosanthes scabra TaxID=79078 RepID=A0ABU6T2J4_9FABA|nr:hypothetical protein [Stylosanthes scabra]
MQRDHFDGTFPSTFGKFQKLVDLDLSDNMLSGDIPISIGNLSRMSLVYLYLQGNSFHGTIPLSLTSLRGLVQLDLSQNHLSGSIPQSLQNLDLEYLNVSFNMLEGEVPTKGVFRNASALTVTGNNNLCGGIPELHLPPCNKHGKHHLLIAIVVSVIAFVLLLCFSLTISWMKKRSSTQEPISI